MRALPKGNELHSNSQAQFFFCIIAVACKGILPEMTAFRHGSETGRKTRKICTETKNFKELNGQKRGMISA